MLFKIGKFICYLMLFFILFLTVLAFKPYFDTHKVKIGMNKSDVLNIHQNRKIETVTNLTKFCQMVSGQPQFFTQPCQMRNPNIAYFMIVSIGIDTRQVIGFDKNDMVIYEMMGET